MHSARLLLLALIALTPVRPAHAHGGKLALRTTAGPYRIEVVVSRIAGTIDESVTVTDAATGRPVVAAAVTLTLTHMDGRTLGLFVAQGAGGLFEARYPPPPGDGWTVTITVSGPGGEAEARYKYTAPGRGASPVLTIITGAALFVVMPMLAWRIWRKKGE